MEHTLNKLIQRGVEHGLIQFFDRMESSSKRRIIRPDQDDRRFQSAAITMDNIWIYIYIFAAGNCVGGFVFLGELAVFHRSKVWLVIGRTFWIRRRIIV